KRTAGGGEVHPRPAAIDRRVAFGGALGQQAVNVLAAVEAFREPLVGHGQLLARLRRPGRVPFLALPPVGTRAGGRPLRGGPLRTGGVLRGHSSLSSPGRRVRISTPSAVTATMCSHCADSERSLVTTVQPSGRTRVWRLPALIIGSMVKVMPSCSTTPSPGRP